MGTLEQDIDEHLSKEEANDGREEWIEERLEDAIKVPSVMEIYWKDNQDEVAEMILNCDPSDDIYQKISDHMKKWLRWYLGELYKG